MYGTCADLPAVPGRWLYVGDSGHFSPTDATRNRLRCRCAERRYTLAQVLRQYWPPAGLLKEVSETLRGLASRPSTPRWRSSIAFAANCGRWRLAAGTDLYLQPQSLSSLGSEKTLPKWRRSVRQ